MEYAVGVVRAPLRRFPLKGVPPRVYNVEAGPFTAERAVTELAGSGLGLFPAPRLYLAKSFNQSPSSAEAVAATSISVVSEQAKVGPLDLLS